MTRDFFYCSELSRASDERAYGTASVGGVWLLLEYTREWKPRAFEDSALPPEVKNRLHSILRGIPHSRLLFVKQQRRAENGQSFFVVRAREQGAFVVRFALESYEELSRINVAAVARGRALEGGTRTFEPLFLVCTHGRRDKCCAKFGFPLYKSLRERAGEQVWQSSHVGGDRFAANLVCFPDGLFYAHVTEDAGRRILEEHAAHRLYLDKYRGRSCYSYPVQAAEFFVRRESGLRGLDELRNLSYERLGERSWRVRFVAPGEGRVHEALIGCRQSEFQNYVTCEAAEPRAVTQFYLDEYRSETDPAAARPPAPPLNDC